MPRVSAIFAGRRPGRRNRGALEQYKELFMSRLINAARAIGLASLCALGIQAPAARAAYPDAPIKLIIPYAPGGNVDITARAVGTAMARILNQTIVMQNMPGAGSTVGAGYVARAKPDGYTMLCTTLVALITDPTLIPGSKVKPEDFEPVGMMSVVPSVLEVKADNKYGIKDFDGFITYAKAHPGAVALANSGMGTTNHIAELLLERDFGIKTNIIPYKGSTPALTDLLGGQTDAIVDQLTSSQPMIKAGKLLPLASTAAKRSPDLPGVPTIAELGKKDFEMVTSTVLVMPKGTPLAMRQTLNDALNKALADPAVLRTLHQVGANVAPGSIDNFSKVLASETAKLQPLIDSGAIAPHKN
jgi:tripartite-type tricarboxylate transporter receptor subunit TctC